MTIVEFKQALREAASAEFQDIPRDDTRIAHNFSPQFQRKMDKLIRNERSSAWHLVNTTAKRTAVILIVFLALSTVALSTDSIREPVVRFVEKVLRISTDYTFEGDVTKSITQEYTLGFVPEGFELVQSEALDGSIIELWENTDGGIIQYIQAITSSSLISIDAEHGATHTILIDDKEVILFQDNDVCIAMWIENGYVFEIIDNSGLSTEDTIEMVRSVVPAVIGR